ncbi:isoaspartyl peptidase/L-asparaginase [uncultured Maritalea sp.]|uniref:isoaspartyl peptidase/L-asparaginase family protein n=1 Tax=uncultured Maritalea sp. TaxID=757249 RepID=UPI00261A833B|nr:isoaspartyl peptidase/L-asparaginase [uncultured Maritalea sp.]
MEKVAWGIALHGGAGTITRDKLTPEKEAECHEGLAAALKAGSDILQAGGTSLDAVEATVRSLEDNVLFNAGKGAVLTSEGNFELDASIMDGKDLDAGGVINVGHIANPISLARAVMEKSDHVLLCGEGAEQFASSVEVPFVEQAYFDTPYRREQLAAAKEQFIVTLDHSDHKFGTVGAVARDRSGNLAAATSTGGMTNKKPGRVGDTPIVGAGTFADNRSCAVSATGHGEMFIRLSVAHDISALMRYKNLSLADAVHQKVMEELPTIDGRGGVISIGKSGAPVLCFNTAGMYRASQVEGDEIETQIFENET